MLAKLNDHDRKIVQSAQEVGGCMIRHARTLTTRTDKLWLQRMLRDVMHNVTHLSERLMENQPPERCYQIFNLVWDEEWFPTLAEILKPMDVGMAKVLLMRSSPHEGICSLDDLRAHCARHDTPMPFAPMMMFYPAGTREVIVAGLKNPEAGSDIDIIAVCA